MPEQEQQSEEMTGEPTMHTARDGFYRSSHAMTTDSGWLTPGTFSPEHEVGNRSHVGVGRGRTRPTDCCTQEQESSGEGVEGVQSREEFTFSFCCPCSQPLQLDQWARHDSGVVATGKGCRRPMQVYSVGCSSGWI